MPAGQWGNGIMPMNNFAHPDRVMRVKKINLFTNIIVKMSSYILKEFADLGRIPLNVTEMTIVDDFYNNWCDLYENEAEGGPSDEDVIIDLSRYTSLIKLIISCGEDLCPVEIRVPTSCSELIVCAKLFPEIIGGSIERIVSDCKYVPDDLVRFEKLKECEIHDYGFDIHREEEIGSMIASLREKGVNVEHHSYRVLDP